MGEMPPIEHIALKPETAYCVVSASHRFSLPVEGLLSILLVEGGKVGMESRNTNGSVDLGPMQINSVWLSERSPLFGYVTANQLRDDLCTNIHSAAWIVASQLQKVKDIWSAVGKYHAPYNASYAWSYKLRVNQKLAQARTVLDQTPVYRQYMASFYGAAAVEAKATP